MIEWFIIVTFWLSYLAITFASVVTIADFVQRVAQRKRAMQSVGEQESVKLHISGGLLEVDRLQDEKQEN